MNENVNATTTYCYKHPGRETMLRCNRCNQPICTECAVLTPTGYRCKDCVRGQLKTFDTAQWIDYPLAFFVAAALSFIGSYIASFLGFFTILIAPIAGGILAEAVRWVVRRHRSPMLVRVAMAGTILGALPLLLIALLRVLMPGAGVFGLLSLLWPAVYTFLVVSTSYYRLSGIQIR